LRLPLGDTACVLVNAIRQHIILRDPCDTVIHRHNRIHGNLDYHTPGLLKQRQCLGLKQQIVTRLYARKEAS